MGVNKMKSIYRSALAVNFQLFEDMKGVAAVNLAMTKHLARSTQMKSYKVARDYMEKVQEKYERFGAYDTEPDWEIDLFLSKFFEEERFDIS